MKKTYKLNSFIQLIDQKIREESFAEQYYYEDKYLREYNQICPHCTGKIKMSFRNILTVKSVVGCIKLEHQKLSISYALCKKCSKFLASATDVQKKDLREIIKTNLMSTLKL